MMKKALIIIVLIAISGVVFAQAGKAKPASFRQKVFDYTKNKEWKYEGSLPCIVDFYADWCGPCRKVSPLLEEIAKDFSGKLIVYKVDTDKEKILSSNLGIQSLPTILFIPVSGKPQAIMGAYPKEDLLKLVNEILK